jgi:DNA-directed RNA polymerase subunit RPC12/RpoP
MPVRCANCRGYFSQDEIVGGKPPRHPWKLTPAGEQALHDNQLRGGDHYPCPACGHRTLVPKL